MAEIDKKIGAKIKEIRNGWGISQMELAERIGVSFQQIQKYEKGMTRMSVHRLQQIAEALGAPITTFLEKADHAYRVSGPAPTYGTEESGPGPPRFLARDEITLLKLFRKIRNKKLREGLLQQVRGVLELEKS